MTSVRFLLLTYTSVTRSHGCQSVQVRCSDFDAGTQHLVTLDVGGGVVLWDPLAGSSMRVTRRFQLDASCREECTCLNVEQSMLSVGARDYVTFYDTRRRDSVASVPIAKVGYSQEFPAHGGSIAARSLAVRGCLLSVGLSTGGGVMFFDKRKLATCVGEAGPQGAAAARSKFACAMGACATSKADSHVGANLAGLLQRQTVCAGE
jgi:hypothetical protein